MTASALTAPAREDVRLALRAATLYYLDGLTQADVADRLGVSRPTAGRLIARAKARGLVRIEVVVPPELRDDVHADAERSLEDRFGLTEAVVTGRGGELGRAAAALLTRRLAATDTMGFTWGPETVAMAGALPAGAARCRVVVQLDGAISLATYQTGADYVLGRCAEQLNAAAVRLPAPLYADPATVSSLRADSVVSRAIDAGRTADVMVFGVGTVSASTTLVDGAFVDAGMLDELIELGAVGEIGGRFFDTDGQPVPTELAHRAVSVPLPDIRACAKTILICSDRTKLLATRAALRGGLARLLVCDIDTAQQLLDAETGPDRREGPTQ